MSGRKRLPREIIFMRSVVKHESGCWIWNGETNSAGYGTFRDYPSANEMKKKRVMAHRASYKFFVGRIPKGKEIMHKCDIKLCVNPKHLKPGTKKENEADKVAKGRSNRGEQRWSTILANEQAQNILDSFRAGDSISSLADKFGVSYWIAYSIAKRLRWKYLV